MVLGAGVVPLASNCAVVSMGWQIAMCVRPMPESAVHALVRALLDSWFVTASLVSFMQSAAL
jgi:hypothetical protein